MQTICDKTVIKIPLDFAPCVALSSSLWSCLSHVCSGGAEIAQFDYDYEQTTDGRYDLRPYGPYLPSRRPGSWYNTAAAMATTTLQMTSLVVTVTLTMLILQRAPMIWRQTTVAAVSYLYERRLFLLSLSNKFLHFPIFSSSVFPFLFPVSFFGPSNKLLFSCRSAADLGISWTCKTHSKGK